MTNKPWDIDFEKQEVERDKIRRYRQSFLLNPEFWKIPQNNINLKLDWQFVKFSKENAEAVPNIGGVYIFSVVPPCANLFMADFIFYVGRAEKLKERYRQYISEAKGVGKPRPKVYEMLNKWNGNIYFNFAKINSTKNIRLVERKLILSLIPPVNTTIEGSIVNSYKDIFNLNY